MQENQDTSSVERRLIAELTDLERKIGEMVRERESIQRILLRLRAQNAVIRRTDVTRKNSGERILIETSILETIQNAKKAVPTHRLYSTAQSIVYHLKENTFRSHLHRMKKRGLIKNKRPGEWEMSRGS
jgi:hypothetical protein